MLVGTSNRRRAQAGEKSSNEADDPNKSETVILIGWFPAREDSGSDFTPAEVEGEADKYQILVGKIILGV